MNLMKFRIVTALLWLFACGAVLAAETVYDVRDYGAKPDGKTLCTESIQRAIDRCAADGGGTVYLGPGTFLSGTIYMKSSVTLKLDPACTLLGSKNLNDYPETVQAFRSYTDNYTDKSLIYGEKLQRSPLAVYDTASGDGDSL